MASAETKVVIALLILAVGFFYTSARDRMTGYVPAQKTVDMEEYGFTADESDQALQTVQQTEQQKEPVKEEQVSLQELFPSAVDPCSDNIPSQIQTLVQGAC